MKKIKIMMIAALGLFAASCSNTDLETSDAPKHNYASEDDVIFAVNNATGTRNNMNNNLVNTWKDGDNLGVFSTYDNEGTATANGKTDAKFVFHETYNSYSNVFVQDAGETDRVKWQNGSSKHTFMTYSPYVASATAAAVPFTLTNTQTQTTPNSWVSSNGTDAYNFMWKSVSGTRPYDKTIPFNLNRMLPVVDIDIVRDDASLDGYYLQSITLVSEETGKLKAGSFNVDLSQVATYNAIPSSTLTDVNEYTVNTTTDVNDATKGINVQSSVDAETKDFHIYMSINPCELAKHSISARFTKADGSIKVIKVDRDSQNFTITNGKGNMATYYIISSEVSAKNSINVLCSANTKYNVLGGGTAFTRFCQSPEFNEYCPASYTVDVNANGLQASQYDKYQIISLSWEHYAVTNSAEGMCIKRWLNSDEDHVLILSSVTEGAYANFPNAFSWLKFSNPSGGVGGSAGINTLNTTTLYGDFEKGSIDALKECGILGSQNPILAKHPDWEANMDYDNLRLYNSSVGDDGCIKINEGSTIIPLFYSPLRRADKSSDVRLGIDIKNRVLIGSAPELWGPNGHGGAGYGENLGLPRDGTDSDLFGWTSKTEGCRAGLLYFPVFADPGTAVGNTSVSADCTKERISGFRTGRILAGGIFAWMFNHAKKSLAKRK